MPHVTTNHVMQTPPRLHGAVGTRRSCAKLNPMATCDVAMYIFYTGSETQVKVCAVRVDMLCIMPLGERVKIV